MWDLIYKVNPRTIKIIATIISTVPNALRCFSADFMNFIKSFIPFLLNFGKKTAVEPSINIKIPKIKSIIGRVFILWNKKEKCI